MFPQAPVVDFRCQQTLCHCGAVLKVQKTQRKRVVSLAGTFISRQTLMRCDNCNQVFADPGLQRWVPRGCNTAWDVLVFVGRQLFEHCRPVAQVRAELLSRDVCLSDSQIAKLGRKFILYLALAHRRATPRIKQAMALSGGYVLHLDAVHQEDAPALVSGIDGLSRLVLANVKVPSEHADQIIPFLEQLKGDYGDPIACVHDMGTGICKAVAAVFGSTRDYICHFHFLRDVGKDLLEPAYRQLRSCLRRHATSTRLSALARQARKALGDHADAAGGLAAAIAGASTDADNRLLSLGTTYALALWCLQGKHSGDGYGFPFDRPLLCFAERLLAVIDHLPGLLRCLPDDNPSGNRTFLKLSRKICDVVGDPLFEPIVVELRWRCELFDQMRRHMRIAEPGGQNGLNDEGSQVAMGSIENGVASFRRQLQDDAKLSKDPLCRKVVKQIDKYADKLFATPILVQTPSGPDTVYPQRTNNIIEQFFRRLRRDHRRRTGDNSMHRALQTMLADTPLVKNLSNPEYMQILLNGKPNLEELFAELDMDPATKKFAPASDADRILPGFKSLTKMSDLPDRITQVAMAAAGR